MNVARTTAGRGVKSCLTVLTLLGALLASPAYAEEELALKFSMPTTPANYLLPCLIANDLGWYAKDGLKLTEQVVTGDVNSLRAVISGDADVTEIGPGTVMQGYAAGAPLKIIGAWQPIVDYRIVARTDAGATLADLKDKRWASFGPGSMTQQIPRMMLLKHGADPTNAKFLAVGGYAARLQALLADKVDATILDTYFTLMGVNSGQAKMMSSVADDFPGLGFAYLVTTKDALANPTKRKALEIFVRDGIRGVRLIQDNPQQASEILAKRLDSRDIAVLVDVLKQMNALGVWGPNGGLEKTVFDFSEKVYRDNGDISRDVTYDELVDPSLVAEAIGTIGKR